MRTLRAFSKKTVVSLTGLLLMTAASAMGQIPDTAWVSGMDLSKVRQGWGEPQKDLSVDKNKLKVGGKTFSRGLGTHAGSMLYIALNGKAERFRAYVGVDDEVGKNPGTVVFRIFGDKKPLWKSPVMKAGDPAVKVDIALPDLQTLILVVEPTDDGPDYDHADWADAFILYNGNRPEAQAMPVEAPYILTPKTPEEPRINGPGVYGARPGRPFLFKIPATGKRPMNFFIDNLPEGLELDRDRGIISGSLKTPGTYLMKVKVFNELGKSSRNFRIVIGDQVALTPPMGWNSWNCFAGSVNAEKVLQAADAMVSSGLSDHGWSYVNIDDCWSISPGSKDAIERGEPRDKDGNININSKFTGMRGLTDYIHVLGLKAGIYSSPGPLTCAGFTASYGHEEQDAAQIAAWGFDYLKYDWCSYRKIAKDNSLPELKKPYQVMRDALDKTGRDIVYSLCQYGMGRVWEWGREVGGNCWRTTGDISDTWESMSSIGFGQAGREAFAGPGHWNDPDMLVVGKVGWGPDLHPTQLTPDEQYTHISLWCLLSAPLLIGCDMTQIDDFTMSLLTNDEVIGVNQDALGKQARRISQKEDAEVWMKEMEDGSVAVGLFNRSYFEAPVEADFAAMGLTGKQKVRDLWRQQDLGEFEKVFSTKVPSHGVVLIRLWPVK